MIEIPSGLDTGPQPSRGLLVSLSGVDGSGKTTTIRRMKSHLTRSGYQVHVFKLPSRECKQLALFKDYKLDPLTAESEGRVDIFSMFLAVAGDRLNTIKTAIVPRLDNGHAVIVDRYLYSAICEVLIASNRMTHTQWGIMSAIVAEFPTPHVAFFTRASFIEARKRILLREAEKDDHIDPKLFGRRIEAFERVRQHFDGVLVDTALDDHSCFKITTRELRKVGQRRSR